MVLVVAMARGRSAMPELKLDALTEGLAHVAARAKHTNASVHLPRIGHGTPKFNW